MWIALEHRSRAPGPRKRQAAVGEPAEELLTPDSAVQAGEEAAVRRVRAGVAGSVDAVQLGLAASPPGVVGHDERGIDRNSDGTATEGRDRLDDLVVPGHHALGDDDAVRIGDANGRGMAVGPGQIDADGVRVAQTRSSSRSPKAGWRSLQRARRSIW